MGPVAVVTCQSMPEPDVDQDVLMTALRTGGVDARLVAWDADPQHDWSQYSLAVIRSTWNYIDHLDRFHEWVEAAAGQTSVFNPAAVITWNTHKGYLRDLADRGVPVVPTAWVGRGAGTTLAQVMERPNCSAVVTAPSSACASLPNSRACQVTFSGPDNSRAARGVRGRRPLSYAR